MTTPAITHSSLPTAALPSTTTSPVIRSVRVEVIRGPDAGNHLRGATERVVIGSHRTADLVLSDRTVSRFHLELVIEGDAVVVRDLGSRNGTHLDGVEVETVRLKGPAIITLGETELRIDLLGDTVPLALAPQERFGELIGISPVMRLAFARLHQATLHNNHVTIEGERGTGKDLAAAAIHELGMRRTGPLDVIDCRAPALEVDAELFGKGDRAGALERCHGGTLVLDEVGSLVRTTQRVLVRALEDRVTRRHPADVARMADVRIIALSRRNLWTDVNADRFAPELFELIGSARIRLPPLRERPEDIPLLVAHILSSLAATGTRVAAQLQASETLEQLRASPWPGNVRELRAYIEQSILADGTPDDEPATVPLIDASLALRDARRRWVRYFERAYVTELLARTSGNVSQAAVLAGVDRVYMHRMITRAGLRDDLSRSRDS